MSTGSISFRSLNSAKLERLANDASKAEEDMFTKLQNENIIDKNEKYTPKGLKKGIQHILQNDSNSFNNETWRKYKILDTDKQWNEEEQKILDDLISSVNTVKGINFLKEEILKNNGSEERLDFRAGLVNELFSLYRIKDYLEKQFGDSATVMDSSPKEFGDSVRYDIKITFTEQTKDKDKLDYNLFFENKLGITSNNPEKVSFHMGDYSSAAFYRSNDIYSSLENKIKQEAIKQLEFKGYRSFVQTKDDNMSYHGYINFPSVMQEQTGNNFIDISIIEYLDWRLRNNYPFFISQGGGVLLCSEVINYMNRKNKTSYIYDVPDETIHYSYESKYYTEENYDEFLQKLGTDAIWTAEDTNKAVDKILKNFKVNLFYGNIKNK